MIYTSYFAKYKGNKGCNIALHPPKNIGKKVKHSCRALYPTEDLLRWYKGMMDQIAPLDNKDTIDEYIQKRKEIEKQYAEIYNRDVLYRLNPHSVAAKLDGYVLLCYEKSGSFCHRHLVAEWLRKFGYDVQELVYKHELKGGVK